MKRIITYGTFDLLHYGHINLLRRARSLGDYLIVALSTYDFNGRKGKKCFFSFEERKKLVESVRYVDLVIPEESWEQKESDVSYHASGQTTALKSSQRTDHHKSGATAVYNHGTPFLPKLPAKPPSQTDSAQN